MGQHGGWILRKWRYRVCTTDYAILEIRARRRRNLLCKSICAVDLIQQWGGHSYICEPSHLTCAHLKLHLAFGSSKNINIWFMVRVDNGCGLSHSSNKIAIPCEITWKAHFVSSKHLSCARRSARCTCGCRHTCVYRIYICMRTHWYFVWSNPKFGYWDSR